MYAYTESFLMSEAPYPSESSDWNSPGNATEIERRVARLEEAMEALLNTSALEERVIERIEQRLSTAKPSPAADLEKPATAPPPAGPVALPAPPVAVNVPLRVGFLREMGSELRLFFRMIRDPIYHLTWLGTLLPIFAIVFITVWPLVSDWLGPFAKPIWLAPFDLLVAYAGLKAIGRELRRYQLQEAAWRKK